MLESWLGTISRAGFLREFYLHQPHSVAQGASRVVSLLSWDIFWRAVLRSEASDLLAVKDGRPGGDLIHTPTSRPGSCSPAAIISS
jgi:hypothetical protein